MAGPLKRFLTNRGLWKSSQGKREPTQPTSPDGLLADGENPEISSPRAVIPRAQTGRGAWGKVHQGEVFLVGLLYRRGRGMEYPESGPRGAPTGVKGGFEHERNVSCSLKLLQGMCGPDSGPSQTA